MSEMMVIHLQTMAVMINAGLKLLALTVPPSNPFQQSAQKSVEMA